MIHHLEIPIIMRNIYLVGAAICIPHNIAILEVEWNDWIASNEDPLTRPELREAEKGANDRSRRFLRETVIPFMRKKLTRVLMAVVSGLIWPLYFIGQCHTALAILVGVKCPGWKWLS